MRVYCLHDDRTIILYFIYQQIRICTIYAGIKFKAGHRYRFIFDVKTSLRRADVSAWTVKIFERFRFRITLVPIMLLLKGEAIFISEVLLVLQIFLKTPKIRLSLTVEFGHRTGRQPWR